MKIACITLSSHGLTLLLKVKDAFPEADLYVHRSVSGSHPGRSFDRIKPLTARLFQEVEALIYAAPCGVVVRALEGNLTHKTADPAVVVIDAGGRHAISLLSGHEGGANALAISLANLIGAEPIITTTTEALKDVVVGIGCRAGVAAEAVREAVIQGLASIYVPLGRVRYLASADIKSTEPGLLAAAEALGIPLRFIPSDEIRSTRKSFGRSGFVAAKVGLPAVAEPAALLAGRRARLLLPKTVCGPVTVAVAQESSLSLGSDQDIL